MSVAAFDLIAYLSILLWLCSIVLFYLPKLANKPLPLITASLGFLTLLIYLTMFWFELERPPLRTLGETRLCYSLLLALVGLVIYLRHKIRWLMVYSLLMASLFLLINLLHPEVFTKTLMPALQSPWFVPHVVVYLEAYALLAAASLISFRFLFWSKEDAQQTINIADNLVYLGYGFLTMGLIFGALWAKTAWGHYWTWDPKETWALLTWFCYLIYLHIRYQNKTNTTLAYYLLVANLIILLICWFGVNYLPSANTSIHSYTG